MKYSQKMGFIAEPRLDRWHKKPTALLGGIGILTSFFIPFIITIPLRGTWVSILIFGIGMFCLGLYDDIKEIRPLTKLLVQLFLAIGIVLCGVKFTIIPHVVLAVPLTVLWIVAITNAFNILDNMDGLTSGISLISSFCLFLHAYQTANPLVGYLALMISGSALGFFIYNFNPAKIFMGDCGSLFLGFILSLLAVMGTCQDFSSFTSAALIPLSVMIIPIFDTILVTLQRKLNGRPISRGGKDHSSHRLVFLGLSERKSVVLLMILSLVFGLIGVLIPRLNWLNTVALFSISGVFLLFFGIFLSQANVYGTKIQEGCWNKNVNVRLSEKKQE